MKTSAGIVLTTGSLVLIGHSRRGINPPKDWYDDSWTIPKGIVDPGELPVQAMMRELHEETGISLYEYTIYDNPEPEIFQLYKVGNNKRVYVYISLVSEDILGRKLHCDSMIDNPTVSWNGLSELDNFMWVTPGEAQEMVFNSQKELFGDKLKEHMRILREGIFKKSEKPPF